MTRAGVPCARSQAHRRHHVPPAGLLDPHGARDARPSRTPTGPGSQRLYSFQDLATLRVIKRLLDTGVSLQRVRAAVEHLQHDGSPAARRDVDVGRPRRLRGAFARGGRGPAQARSGRVRHLARRRVERPGDRRRRGREAAGPTHGDRRLVSAQPPGTEPLLTSDTDPLRARLGASVRSSAGLLRRSPGSTSRDPSTSSGTRRETRSRRGSRPTSTSRSSISTSRSPRSTRSWSRRRTGRCGSCGSAIRRSRARSSTSATTSPWSRSTDWKTHRAEPARRCAGAPVH